jgi:hypothetical protein
VSHGDFDQRHSPGDRTRSRHQTLPQHRRCAPGHLVDCRARRFRYPSWPPHGAGSKNGTTRNGRVVAC